MEERDHSGMGKDSVKRGNVSWILEMWERNQGVPGRGTGVGKGENMVEMGYSEESSRKETDVWSWSG